MQSHVVEEAVSKLRCAGQGRACSGPEETGAELAAELAAEPAERGVGAIRESRARRLWQDGGCGRTAAPPDQADFRVECQALELAEHLMMEEHFQNSV